MKLRILFYAGITVALAACGDRQSEEPVAKPEAETPAVATETGLSRTPSVDGARLFFITPSDGATVGNPISVHFGLEGMAVVKAGDAQPASGHHHLLIDTGLPNLDLPIPADSNHIHFGDGSTATEITLEPGEHTLQLLLGDHLHIPHEPPIVSAPITITVE